MRLQPPDQLSTVLIWFSAIFMAVREGVEKWPAARTALPAMSAGWLNFVPLALLVIAALVTMARSGGQAGQVQVHVAGPHETPIAQTVSQPGPPGPPDILPDAVATEYRDLKMSRHTDIQELRFLRRFIGKWLSLTGTLFGIQQAAGGLRAHVYFVGDDNESSAVFAKFDMKWEDHLGHLKKGDSISFRAQIVETRSGSIELANAEPL